MRGVQFVLRDSSADVLSQYSRLNVDRDWQSFSDGQGAWILQTFLFLRDHGFRCNLTSEPVPGRINVVHGGQLSDWSIDSGAHLVVARADYPPPCACMLEIVQNRTQEGDNAVWMPHWPQPGLMVRNEKRGSTVKVVGYFGRPVNHYTRVLRRASGFNRVRPHVEEVCTDLGLELVERGPDGWNNFADVDIVLGIRRFGRYTFDTKPPTKLVNAWLAGTAFIGGCDSAYSQVGRHGMNYLVARSPDQLKKTLSSLQKNPGEYAKIVANGRSEAAAFDRERITQRWIDVLSALDS